MHALTLARQRLRARMESPSTPRTMRLAHGLLENGRVGCLPILSSALAQDILTHGYDARTLDRVYSNHPTGDLGLVGKMTDRVVLDLPVHQALRERLEAAVGEICAAAVVAGRAGEPVFRLLSAPCGLASEIVGVADRLRTRHPELFSRLQCWGVDPDLDGNLLPEAGRRTRAAGLDARFIREDLRRRREVAAMVREEGPFHLVSCLGICQAFSPQDVASLVQYYAGIIAPGGTLLIDRWQPAEKSRVAKGLGAEVPCQPGREFETMLRGAGLVLDREHATGEGGCVLTIARKIGPTMAPQTVAGSTTAALVRN
jgi:hypothetical protein